MRAGDGFIAGLKIALWAGAFMARTVKCPGCGADLTVKDGNRDFMFCEFCGTKVRLDDYQETHRFVDEARIQESKDAKELELKKMEFEERKRKEDLKSAFAIIKVSLGITLGGLGILMIGAILETLGVIK